jgi:hypothetical protein
MQDLFCIVRQQFPRTRREILVLHSVID